MDPSTILRCVLVLQTSGSKDLFQLKRAGPTPRNPPAAAIAKKRLLYTACLWLGLIYAWSDLGLGKKSSHRIRFYTQEAVASRMEAIAIRNKEKRT